MHRRNLLIALTGVPLFAACSEDGSKVEEFTDKSPAAFERALAQHAHGFTVGSKTAPKAPVRVIFDPQCPHCGSLWEATKKYRETGRPAVWYPVALLRAQVNRPQGALMLESVDPVATMDEHERKLLAREGGIMASAATTVGLKKMDRNLQIVQAFRVESVPALVVVTAEGVRVLNGVPPAEVLAAIFG